MDRRNFLRTGSLAMLGSLAVPSLAMPASVRGALGGADNQSAVASAMAHFGVTEADLKKVMALWKKAAIMPTFILNTHSTTVWF